MDRPLPPPHLHEPGFKVEPSLEIAAWLKDAFINEGARFINLDHQHLRTVDIVGMWTNVEYVEGGMPVVAMAEIVNVNGKPWARAERTDHLCLLHGNIPQARVWVYAPFWVACDSDTAFGTGDHELYHFAHRKSKEGDEMYDDEDRPMLAKRAHDVGEFVGVAARWGIGACGGKSREFVEAALQPPLFGASGLARPEAVCACGARL